ncbi:MAG: Fur family transcriptional regulator [Anaerolineales bacterium]|jgi:Fe2+ or Zn2+ uptake regulation protein
MTHNKINYLETLHQNGHRLTRQKEVILDAICQADGHATIREFHYRSKKLNDSLDRSTVYRPLDLFVKLGIVISGETIDGERTYELAKENCHHHLICIKCGKAVEIEDTVVDDFYHFLRPEYKYEVDMDHLIVFGI